MIARPIALAVVLFLALVSNSIAADGWKAGVAKANITPKKLMWMSGYGARDKPAEGKLTDLWAKAMVLEDATGQRAVLVTLDLVGIGRDTSLAVCDSLERKYGLARRQVALNCSHTHCGPVVGHNLAAMYFFGEDQWKLVDEYEDFLKEQIAEVVGAAIKNLTPSTVAWSQGEATFAVNRRANKEAEVPELIRESKLKGPVDHDVPVLAVRNEKGDLTAVVFGYACHATVLSFFQWSGDYPGFAQIELEKAHPGALAMFWAGCGADQNPLPRRKVELAEQYGKQLADSVEKVLAGKLTPITGKLDAKYAEVALPLDKLPSREDLQSQTASSNKYEAQRAKLLLAQIDAGKPLSPTYPYPVQVWRLGEGPIWITLGGEVVVDYSLRLKQEVDPKRTWVASYTNDVMAYIPSRRVLLEGGYEGAGAMLYYGLPTIWAPQVEEVVVKQVHELVDAK
jgi:neutral ceramidase